MSPFTLSIVIIVGGFALLVLMSAIGVLREMYLRDHYIQVSARQAKIVKRKRYGKVHVVDYGQKAGAEYFVKFFSDTDRVLFVIGGVA